uniref:BLM10_mid domain-containing protein n=1 Tax=Mesocestoides corti TaxID=53468 RepID=A0A5K3FBT1_MESCO
MTSEEQFQQICRINQLLPYASKLEAYSDAARMGLRATLVRLISSSSYLSQSPHTLDFLDSYVDLFGCRFTKEEYLAIFKFGLGLGLCPQTDPKDAVAWLNFITKILKCCSWTLTSQDLQLNWRDFKNALTRIPGSMDVRYCKEKFKDNKVIYNLLSKCQRFFPVSCVAEIWNEYRAKIFSAALSGPYEKLFQPLVAYTPFMPHTFDEIRRVWLDDIFHIWYKFADNHDLNREVIPLLGLLARSCPGRIDWEPHLDRVFNGIVYDLCVRAPASPGDLKKREIALLHGYAYLVVYSISPGSTTFKRMRDLFTVCKSMFHPSMDSSSMFAFATFCVYLLLVMVSRLRKEFSRCPQNRALYGEIPTWQNLTREQVDDFVDILLPICLDANLYARNSNAVQIALCSTHLLASLRPGLFFPRLLAALESGFELPELPMRVTRPLMVLSETCSAATSLNMVMAWNPHEMGRHPSDQPQYQLAPGEIPPQQTPEQRQFLTSHLSSLLYADGRGDVARILRCCVAGIDVNDTERLTASLKALGELFLRTPMQDFSDVCLPNISERQNSPFLQTISSTLQPHFAASRIALASLEIEDLAMQVYARLLQCMISVNETAHLHMDAKEGHHDTEQVLTSKTNDSRLLCSLTGVAVALGLSASPAPRLRVRLVKLLIDALFANHWTRTSARLLNYQLIWLISGRRGIEAGKDEADVALFAVREFWPRFFQLFQELDNENCITCLGKAEPRLLALLCVLPAYVCALVPSHLAQASQEFIYPLIDVLSRLLTISIGAEGQIQPCHDLAVSASICAGVLLHRLVAFSINLDHVDLLNTHPQSPPSESAYLTNPLWSPYVTWRDMLRTSFWNQPTPESFAVAEHVVRRLLLPTLAKVSEATEELKFYIGDEGGVEKLPQLPQTSSQSSTSLQRQFLVDLVTWVHMISAGLCEALKPRKVTQADVKFVRQVCTELELGRAEVVTVPKHAGGDDVNLDFPWFDVPVDANGTCLREHIFRVGLGLLDVFGKLCSKYDILVADSSTQSNGESVISSLFTQQGLDHLTDTVFAACFNISSCESSPSHVLLNSRLCFILKANLGVNSGTSLCDATNEEKNNVLPSLVYCAGTPQALLEAYERGDAPSTQCGGGSCYLAGFLPIAWLARAHRRHVSFVGLALNRAAVWPGFEAAALVSFTQMPASPDYLLLMEVCAQLSLASNNAKATCIAPEALDEHLGLRVPGAASLVIQRAVDVLKELFNRSFLADNELIYRTQLQRRQKAFVLLLHCIHDSKIFVELRNINPLLWSRAWVAMGKTAAFTAITASGSPSPSKKRSLPHVLSQTQLTQRYNDQEDLSQSFIWIFEEIDGRTIHLHFPTSFEVDYHPRNSSLRCLLGYALELLDVLGGSRSDVVKQNPSLLVLSTSLRREAYSFLCRGLFSECIEPIDMMANAAMVERVLRSWPFVVDPPDNPPWESALPTGEMLRISAPPPPPLPSAMVRMVLGLLTTHQTTLASAAAQFIKRYLIIYFLRSRPQKLILLESNNCAVENESQTDNVGFISDPGMDCLSSDENFTRHNHVPRLLRGYPYLGPSKTWPDPIYSPAYPIFSPDDDSQLVTSEVGWLEPHPQMDFSLFSPADILELRTGLMDTARHMASREFWSVLSHQFLHFHRCADSNLVSSFHRLLSIVANCFGPRPLLERLEGYIMSLIKPALMGNADGIVEFVGPTLAGHAATVLAVGSLSWPREARLAVHSCTLPRVLVATEAAALFASTRPTGRSVNEGLHHALENVRFASVTAAFGNGGGSTPASPESVTSPDDAMYPTDVAEKDRQMLRIVRENRRCYRLNDNIVHGPPVSGMKVDCGGPKVRLPFTYSNFIPKYLDFGGSHSNYLAYLWKFARALMLDANEILSDEPIDGFKLQPPNHAGEPMDSESSHTNLPCTRVCDSHVHPIPVYGECPLCFARRLLPSTAQRRFFFLNLTLSMVRTLHWSAPRLIAQIYYSNRSEWEQMACSSSLWTREMATYFSFMQAGSRFESVTMQAEPILRIYEGSDPPNPVEHRVLAPLASRMTSHLAISALNEVNSKAAVGQDFVMRRFIPLLVRDSIAMLLIRGIQPSAQCFALQSKFLASAADHLTPATPELVGCSSGVKRLVSQQLEARLSSLYVFLSHVLMKAFPSNPPANSSCPSRFSMFLLLTPLIADLVSTSNFFWTNGKSGLNRNPGDAQSFDDLEVCIGRAINDFGCLVCTGHTQTDLSLAQASQLLDIIGVFLSHWSWKTRAFGMHFMKVVALCNATAFWRREAGGEELCSRIKQKLTRALADPWVEVARGACEAVAILLRYGILQFEEQWCQELAGQARLPLCRRPGPFQVSTEKDQMALRRRHAGVLGLCAFINANIHETPDYLPKVIAEVAGYANDPQPIAKSVSDTLMAYSRTHHERWHEERHKFTAAQLDAYLSVVSSVSYYV